MQNIVESPKRIIIVCEDTYGLDVFLMVDAINKSISKNGEQKYIVDGFISDESNPFHGIEPPAPILGSISDEICKPEISYVIAIVDPRRKQAAVEKLKEKGALFETLIAPWAMLPSEFSYGEGCIISNFKLKHKSKIGNFVIMDTAMCETVEIGDYSTLCPFTNITNAKIGKLVFIGTHAAIISNRTINDDVYIYPGSIVLTNVKQGTSVAGVPASSRNAKNWRVDSNE